MKIIVLSVGPPFRGGISEQTELLVENLSIENEVLLLNFKKQYPSILFPGKSQLRPNYNTIRIKDNNIRIIDSVNPYTWKKASKFIIKNKPDLILVRYWHPFFAICHSSIIKKIKKKNDSVKVLMFCDNIVSHEKNVLDKNLSKILIKRCDGIILQSRETEKQLSELNIRVNYKRMFHPIDNNVKIINQNEAKNKLKISSKKNVLFFGLIRKYKGFDTFIDVAAKTIPKDPDINFIAIGEPYHNRKKYMKKIDDYDLGNRFKWIDKYISDELADNYLASSDVVVLPYKSATQSGVIPYAYSQNKPVITTNLLGLSDYVENNKTGFISELGTADEISDIIIKFFDNQKRDFFANNIVEFKKQFSWQKLSHKIIEFSNEL